MMLYSSNCIQKSFSTEIIFRFDEEPIGAESFELKYEDIETEEIKTETIVGEVIGNTIFFDRKFPAPDFVLTNLSTGDSIPFETEYSAFSHELIFVNENNYPTTYIQGFQAKDVYQVIIKTLDDKVWNTFKHGDRMLGGGTDTPDSLDDAFSMSRICFDDEYNWMKSKNIKDGPLEILGIDLRKVIVEIELWQRLEIKTFENLLPISTEEKQAVSKYQGILDYDELGIVL